MNLSNASSFLLSGIAMSVLPLIAPSLCPINGFDGTSAREIWLQVMGSLNAGIGASYLVRAGWEEVTANWIRTTQRASVSAAKTYSLPRNTAGSLSSR